MTCLYINYISNIWTGHSVCHRIPSWSHYASTKWWLLSLAFDELPDGEQIPHVKELGSQDDDLISIDRSSSEALYSSRKLYPPVLISDGISPVPLRLLKRIKQGLFVEIAELHPNYLDSVELNMGYQPTGSHKRVPKILDIVDWIQCFGIYMAIISRSKPK